MTVFVVTDLSYGDAGKGTTVDFLARQAEGSAVVVRHCGGPQAGHNVVTSDGRSHCFAQFGAGTFAGAKTFLSKFMLVNPLNQLLEADHLVSLGEQNIWPRMFVDENALVVTPFHVAVNRLLETARGAGRHGSCGQGIGVTAQVALSHPDLVIRVKDCLDRRTVGLDVRLERLRRHLLTCAPWRTGDPNEQVLADEDIPAHLARRYREWAEQVSIVPSDYLRVMIEAHDRTIFEGAQGVLLDEWFGFHPFTTWSTCTFENAEALLREAGDFKPVKLGVVRAVTTRHGAGPHMTEDAVLTAGWAEPHNVNGQWQGPFRVGHLDLVAHNYAMRVCGGVDQVAVTHLDRASEWKYCDRYDGPGFVGSRIPLSRRGDLESQHRLTQRLMQVSQVSLHDVDEAGLVAAVERHLDAPVTIRSYGPTAEDKREAAVRVANGC